MQTSLETPLEQSLKTAQKLFKKILFDHSLKAVTLARESGVTERQISYFKNSKGSLACESWIQLVRSLPKEAKAEYVNSIFFEDKLTVFYRSFADFLREWQVRENVDQSEFERMLQQRTPISPNRLREILSGELPNDNELGLLGMIIYKPDKSIYTFKELREIRNHSHETHRNH